MCMPCYALCADNDIGKAGGLAMGAALEKNTTLIELSLRGTFCFLDIAL